jgi:putative aldouronate transport system substrate-binding protein
MSANTPLGRRSFLQGAAFTALGATAGAGLLTGCSGTQAATDANEAKNSSVKLPTFIPYHGVKPEYPGNTQGLLDAFLTYPSHPVQATSGKPGPGGSFSALVETGVPIPPGVGANPYWRELNKRIGTDVQLTIVASTDLSTKFSTMIAGDDLPDFMVPPLPPLEGIRGLPQFLSYKCQDLTEFLSGDAIKEYPFLANLPTESWRTCVLDGGIYGLPVSRGVAGDMLFYRADLFDKLGVDPAPGSFTEFRSMCKEVTDAKKSRWAMGTAGGAVEFVNQMLGTPNIWREEGGKLTSYFEDERYKQAISLGRRLVLDGVVHPDSYDPTAPWKNWFNAGNALMVEDRYTSWPQYFQTNVAGAGFKINGMRPPKYGGGGFAGTWQSPPINNFTLLKKASKSRIRELLRIANWLAAPFGTEEYLFRKYGVPGKDYVMKDNSPVQTQAGVTQTVLGIRYITDSPDVLFVPGEAQSTRDLYEYQKSIIPTSVRNPCVALFSETYNTIGAIIAQDMTDSMNDILTGRKPLSSWDDAVKSWRSSGGDQMRSEFEKQLGAA